MARSAPDVRKTQRGRRKGRRVAAGLCLWGLCCPATVEPPHRYCAAHRTREGRT